VAATFEKANIYVFAAPIIRDREVEGFESSRPDHYYQRLTAASIGGRISLWTTCLLSGALRNVQFKKLC
jgi:hypothetical protein